MAVGDDAVIVAFRGPDVIARTSSVGWVRKALNVAGNYLINAQISPREVSASVWIHKGFGEALGEAMAPIAATRLPADGLYTFGAPRVGNAAFSGEVSCPSWRFTNADDIVPCVPPATPDPRLFWVPDGYDHIEQRVHLKADDVVFAARSEEELPLGVGLSWLTAPPWERLRRGLIHHAPLYYAVKIRNAMVRETPAPA